MRTISTFAPEAAGGALLTFARTITVTAVTARASTKGTRIVHATRLAVMPAFRSESLRSIRSLPTEVKLQTSCDRGQCIGWIDGHCFDDGCSGAHSHSGNRRGGPAGQAV